MNFLFIFMLVLLVAKSVPFAYKTSRPIFQSPMRNRNDSIYLSFVLEVASLKRRIKEATKLKEQLRKEEIERNQMEKEATVYRQCLASRVQSSILRDFHTSRF